LARDYFRQSAKENAKAQREFLFAALRFPLRVLRELFLYLSPIAALIAAMIASVTRRLKSSSSFAGERSKSTGDSSIRLMIVPSENPASTNESRLRCQRRSLLELRRSTLTASVGGLMMRTVADPLRFPVVLISTKPPRDRLDDCELEPDPKILSPLWPANHRRSAS
jgi:hypothetical protein